MVRAETDDPMKPWPYQRSEKPFYNDHELPYATTELPTALAADDQDPPETDLYGNQVFQYPWARHVYLAFPTVYYHYKNERAFLSPDKQGGNQGVGEVQLAVSATGCAGAATAAGRTSSSAGTASRSWPGRGCCRG